MNIPGRSNVEKIPGRSNEEKIPGRSNVESERDRDGRVVVLKGVKRQGKMRQGSTWNG